MTARSLVMVLFIVPWFGASEAPAQVRPTIRDIHPDTVVGSGQISIFWERSYSRRR